MVRRSCAGTAPCLPANYPGICGSWIESAHKTLTQHKRSNGTEPFTTLFNYGFPLTRPVTIVTAYSTILFYCINIHIDRSRGSIKRGLDEARFVKSLFKLDSTVRHWHFKRLKSKAQKGYIIRTFFGATCVCVHVSSFVTYS